MGKHIPARRILESLVVTFLLTGCTAGASLTPASSTPTSMPSPAAVTPTPAVATATPVASPKPETYGPVTVVKGAAKCPVLDLGDPTTDAAGVLHFRAGNVTCTMATDDPRASGTETETWNADGWGTLSDGALVQWGTGRLENAGGAWEGTFTGIYSSDRGDIIISWFKGTGGYAGLAYFEQVSGWGPWEIQGQIFPGEPPTP